MKSCLSSLYRHLNIPKVVICLWDHRMRNAGDMENIESMCLGDVASLVRVLLEND